MSCAALMLGDPGEEPFVGHLRMGLSGPGVWLSLAGRVAADGGALAAFVPARRLEMTLREVLTPLLEQPSRNRLLHRAWSTLSGMETLVPGADRSALSLLIVAGDADGIGVSGVGLSMVWGRLDGRWRRLVREDHPLLQPAAAPQQTPGVLGLTVSPTWLLGAPAHLPAQLPSGDVLRCAGVHR